MKRFQDCNWIIKTWRYRWYLLIPIWTLLDCIKTRKLCFNFFWQINIGIAQCKMNWVYTQEEILDKLNRL